MTSNDELRRLAEAATPGPWEWCEDQRFLYNKLQDHGVLNHGETSWPVSDENAAFIAAASPDRVLRLLDENEALRKERDELRGRVLHLREHGTLEHMALVAELTSGQRDLRVRLDAAESALATAQAERDAARALLCGRCKAACSHLCVGAPPSVDDLQDERDAEADRIAAFVEKRFYKWPKWSKKVADEIRARAHRGGEGE